MKIVMMRFKKKEKVRIGEGEETDNDDEEDDDEEDVSNFNFEPDYRDTHPSAEIVICACAQAAVTIICGWLDDLNLGRRYTN
ncbi:hypothetical protein ElyMa_001659100 [Elysia marginata]|uniref:Uncharacterized protein n=1 Tax=Elysia marginata TaxID=1093978 RepID=A0AAV4JNB8_9GAST|nr:hypothetical protein ElyMa_001659100 [Elysia marginata]